MEKISEVAREIGYGIALFCLLQIYIIGYIKRKEFFEDIKGRDGKWQLVEVSAILWYFLFPMVVIVNICGVEVEPSVWLSLDGIYVANLTAIKAGDYINLRWGDKSKPDSTDETKDSKNVKQDEAL